jgi:hypothetical protein
MIIEPWRRLEADKPSANSADTFVICRSHT